MVWKQLAMPYNVLEGMVLQKIFLWNNIIGIFVLHQFMKEQRVFSRKIY